MNKKNILYILIGLLILSIIPESKLDIITYIAFAGFCFYIHHKEKTAKFCKDFEIWLKNDQNIHNEKFTHELDREYCILYHQIFDPRINSVLRKTLVEDLQSLREKRVENGLPKSCPLYEKLCLYARTYY